MSHFSNFLKVSVLVLFSVCLSGCLAVYQKLPGTLNDVSKSPLVGIWVITPETNAWMDEEVDNDAEKLGNDVMVFQPSQKEKGCLMWVQEKRALTQQEMEERLNPDEETMLSRERLVMCVLPVSYKGKYYFQLIETVPSKFEKLDKDDQRYFVFRADISEDGKTMTMGTFEEKELEELLEAKTKIDSEHYRLETGSKAVAIKDFLKDPEGLMAVLATAPLKKAGVYRRSE